MWFTCNFSLMLSILWATKEWKFDHYFSIKSPFKAMHLAHLCLSFLNPFKIEGLFMVPLLLFYCLYDAFIASILCTMKMGFQFWEQIEVRRSHITRIWGWGRISNPHSVAAAQSWQFVTCGQGRRTARAGFDPVSLYFTSVLKCTSYSTFYWFVLYIMNAKNECEHLTSLTEMGSSTALRAGS